MTAHAPAIITIYLSGRPMITALPASLLHIARFGCLALVAVGGLAAADAVRVNADASVDIAGDVAPTQDGTFDLGSMAAGWGNAHVGSLELRDQVPLHLAGDIDQAKWLVKLGGYALSFASDFAGQNSLEDVIGPYDGRNYGVRVRFDHEGAVSCFGAALQGPLKFQYAAGTPNQRRYRLDPYQADPVTGGEERLNLQALDDGGAWLRDIAQFHHDGLVRIEGSLDVRGPAIIEQDLQLSRTVNNNYIVQSQAAYDAGNAIIIARAGGGNCRKVVINADQGLEVNGNIVSQNIVQKPGEWSDHVFDDDYVLKPLSEVAEFIDAHRHLPEIPSEAEILAQGLDSNAMFAAHMAKIEELTLYAIQAERERDQARQERDAAHERLAAVEQRLARLEALLLVEDAE